MGSSRLCLAALLAFLLIIGGCAKKEAAPPPPVPESGGEATAIPAGPSEPPGWRYITTTGATLRLTSVSPDGSSFLLTSNTIGDRENDQLVTIGDQLSLSKPLHRRQAVTTPANWRADILSLPWGEITLEAGSDRSNEGGSLSPDRRYVAITSEGGLWLGDLQNGEARLISPAPAEPVWGPDIGRYNPPQWANVLGWAEDSQSVYVYSNLRGPEKTWQIPIDGGPAVPVDYPGKDEHQAVHQRIQADGFFFRTFSPDGEWAAADKTESPTFRLYNVRQPELSITHTDQPDHYAGVSGWSSDSRKVAFHARPVHDLARFIGVLDVGEGGQPRYYAFPDPLAGLPVAHGFIGNDQLLVSLTPWDTHYRDTQWPSQEQWWLLDLKAVPPLEGKEPTRLVSVHLHGEPYRDPAGLVSGGETVLVGAAPVSLRFDCPVSSAWLQANVVVEGTGATLETGEALLGLATVRITAGAPGDIVRIRVPRFGYDLQIRRADPLKARLEVRHGNGPWELVEPDRLWPRAPLDLRLTFNRPVDEQSVADQVVRSLRTGMGPPEGKGYGVSADVLGWEDGALLLHVEHPVSLLLFSLRDVHDRDGVRLDGPIFLLRTGMPPVGFDPAGRPLIIRWADSKDRYNPDWRDAWK